MSCGMHRITDDQPVALAKNGQMATRVSLDHCVSRSALDMRVQAKTDPTLRVSDHIPSLVWISIVSPSFYQEVWLQPPKTLKPKLYHPLRNEHPTNLRLCRAT